MAGLAYPSSLPFAVALMGIGHPISLSRCVGGIALCPNQARRGARRQGSARTKMSSKKCSLREREFRFATSPNSPVPARPNTSLRKKPAATRAAPGAGFAVSAHLLALSTPCWLTSSPASADRRAR